MYELPKLPYAYDALEPFFDRMTMEIHHTKHHQTYVNNANALLSDLKEFQDKCAINLIQNLDELPENKRTALRNNLGGHVNHSFFWQILKTGTKPHGSLHDAILRDFGSLENFYADFEAAALSRFGSGWTWLVSQNGKLKIITTANQDNPLMGEAAGATGVPIIGLDVWEHAYYLRYQNRRADFIKAFFQIINWDNAQKEYEKAN